MTENTGRPYETRTMIRSMVRIVVQLMIRSMGRIMIRIKGRIVVQGIELKFEPGNPGTGGNC